jgi:NADH-quinone oxidoreductase subunit H
MKFAMFYLVEYAEALALSAVITTIFLSGWKGPFLPPFIWFVIKVFAVFGLMIWTRSTFPRVRIDQLMALAWKFMFPLALINLLLTGVEVLIWPDSLSWLMVIVNLAIMAVLVVIWSRSFKVGGGRLEVNKTNTEASQTKRLETGKVK